MVEELFKKYYPEYVTEKGECLSPYWDLFSTGIECATDELNKGCIQTLTKENVELKARLNAINLLTPELKKQSKAKKQQLIKAKEIIGNLYAICKDNHYPNSSVLMEQAEQFLKEGEK